MFRDFIDLCQGLLTTLKDTPGSIPNRALFIVIFPLSIIFFLGLTVYAVVDRIRALIRNRNANDKSNTPRI